MILVKTKLSTSGIHGIGIFTQEFIPKDTIVWRFEPGFDLVMTREQVDVLSDAAKEQFFSYAYVSLKTGNYILCSDDSRFFNHESMPNTTCYVPNDSPHPEDLVCIANRDIKIGEELTNNYSEFDKESSDGII